MKNTVLRFEDVEDIVIEGIDPKDHPDYADAYIYSATHIEERRPCTETELDLLSASEEFYDFLMRHIE